MIIIKGKNNFTNNNYLISIYYPKNTWIDIVYYPSKIFTVLSQYHNKTIGYVVVKLQRTIIQISKTKFPVIYFIVLSIFSN